MTEPEALLLLRAVFASEFEIEPDEVLPRARLREDFELDSIDAVLLAARLESETGVLLKDEKLKSLRTVRDVISVLQGIPLPARA